MELPYWCACNWLVGYLLVVVHMLAEHRHEGLWFLVHRYQEYVVKYWF